MRGLVLAAVCHCHYILFDCDEPLRITNLVILKLPNHVICEEKANRVSIEKTKKIGS